jgi:hypothetical protein
MDRLIVSIPLKDEHTGTFVIGRIILYDYRAGQSSQDVVDEQVIVCQLVVSMIRDLHLPPGDQFTNPLKRLAHRTSWQETALRSVMSSYMRHLIYSRPFDLKHINPLASAQCLTLEPWAHKQGQSPCEDWPCLSNSLLTCNPSA